MNDEIDVSPLRQILGSYFHQDWNIEFSDVDAVLAEIVSGESTEAVSYAIGQISNLLRCNMSEDVLEKYLRDQCGVYYQPHLAGETYSGFALQLLNGLKRLSG